MGHVAFDGTKIRANALIQKGMRFGRMERLEQHLVEDFKRYLEESQQVDDKEDAEFGAGNRGDELPPELANRESRLKKLCDAKAALECEAKGGADKVEARRIALQDYCRQVRPQQPSKRQTLYPAVVAPHYVNRIRDGLTWPSR